MTSPTPAREPSAEALPNSNSIVCDLVNAKQAIAFVWSPALSLVLDRALAQARSVAYERAARAVCPYCAGDPAYSKYSSTPKMSDGSLVHLTQGYPPCYCRAAGIYAMAAEERA